MPMHGTPILDADGKVIGIACSRGSRFPKCCFCKGDNAKLACDGCDRALCPACAVGPTSKLDFCPKCALPAFDWWKANAGGGEIYEKQGRPAGRVAFRAWVKANAEKFNELVGPRSEASKAEEP